MELMKMVIDVDQRGSMSIRIQDEQGLEHRVAPEIVLVSETEVHRVGALSRFRILPYHFTDSYPFQTDLGVLYVEDGMLYYLSSQTGVETIRLDGRAISSFTVELPQLPTPSIVTPSPDSVAPQPTVTVTGSSYSPPAGQSYAHQETRWQLATDANFTQIVRDYTSSIDLTSTVMDGLSYGTTYWVRCMYLAELQ